MSRASAASSASFSRHSKSSFAWASLFLALVLSVAACGNDSEVRSAAEVASGAGAQSDEPSPAATATRTAAASAGPSEELDDSRVSPGQSTPSPDLEEFECWPEAEVSKALGGPAFALQDGFRGSSGDDTSCSYTNQDVDTLQELTSQPGTYLYAIDLSVLEDNETGAIALGAARARAEQDQQLTVVDAPTVKPAGFLAYSDELCTSSAIAGEGITAKITSFANEPGPSTQQVGCDATRKLVSMVSSG